MDRTRLTLSVLVLLALALALSGGGVIGSAPPFATDKLSVLVVEESAEHGKYNRDQLNVIQATDAKSVKAIVEGKGGRFHVIDKDVSAERLTNAPDWVKAAMTVKRDSLPWIVGATPRSGFSMPLVTESEVLAKVEGL